MRPFVMPILENGEVQITMLLANRRVIAYDFNLWRFPSPAGWVWVEPTVLPGELPRFLVLCDGFWLRMFKLNEIQCLNSHWIWMNETQFFSKI